MKSDYAGEMHEGMKPASNHLRRSGYRSPTEAEWEHACRAGAGTAYGFGEPDELLDKYAWYIRNSGFKSHVAGTLKPNDFGLFDMHGSLLEWCDDWYNERGADRVARGGGWYFVASYCQAAHRYWYEPSFRNGNLGFRPARSSVSSQGK